MVLVPAENRRFWGSLCRALNHIVAFHGLGPAENRRFRGPLVGPLCTLGFLMNGVGAGPPAGWSDHLCGGFEFVLGVDDVEAWGTKAKNPHVF